MCESCHSLEDLKLPKVNSLSSCKIAYDCEHLKTVECPLFFMDKEQDLLHNNMFYDCKNLCFLNCANAKSNARILASKIL